jgi:DNA-binding transcriptional regulator YhcF (GntR family)
MLEDFKIDRAAKIPISKQIACEIRKLVLRGQFKGGDRLPTVQKLAQSLGVGSRTASEAIKLLQAEGILEANPRRGTFVRDLKDKGTMGKKENISHYLKIAVIKNNGKHPRETEANDLEILKGIFSEGDRCNSVIQILPESLVEGSANDVFNKIINFGSRVIIWLTPGTQNWSKVKYLRSHNIPVVIARRWRVINGGCCVQADFNSAGFEIGEKFIKRGCKRVLIFDDNRKPAGEKSNQPLSFAMSIREGLIHSFSEADKYEEGKVKIEKLKSRSPQAGGDFLNQIKKLGPETGIVFCDGYTLTKILETEGEQIRIALSDKNFVVAGYSMINSLIMRRLKGLDFWLLNEPLEDIGKASVQKALSIHQGYLSDTATLVKVKMELVNW